MTSLQANDTVADTVDCISRNKVGMIYVFALALPVHLFLLWILFKKFADGLPRHTILKSLCISDVLLLVVGGTSIAIGRLPIASFSSVSCKVIHKSFAFQSAVTLVASSGTIIGLSVERYVACVYCLRLHAIVTEKRVITCLKLLWAIAICFALLSTFFSGERLPLVEPRQPSLVFTYAMIIIIFFTCFVLITIQVILFFVYRKKHRITPHQSFGEPAELSNTVKRQIKLTISVAALAAFYTVCLFPLTMSYLNKAITGQLFENRIHSILGIIGTSNTIFDPLVYGLGLADVRKQTLRELFKVKRWCVERFCTLP
eukprot:gene16924-8412_t